MNLNRIEQFICVADTGSIRAAARTLGDSQPALTRSIQQLEHDVGAQLMRRSVHGVTLTIAGRAFLARARVAHAELMAGAHEARRSGSDELGLVSVGVSPSAATLLLPEFVTSLQRQRPGLRIRLHESSPGALLPLVREEALDMAVAARSTSNLSAGLRFRALFEIQMRVVVRAGHPLAAARTLDELVGCPWLSMAAPESAGDIVKVSFAAAGLEPPVPAVHCGSHSVALDIISASDMIGLLPPALLRSYVSLGRLVELPLMKPLTPLVAGLYTRSEGTPSPAIKASIQVITGIARRLASTGNLRSTAPITSPR